MKKMENIDLISTMQSIVDIHTKSYKEDFLYDKESLIEAAKKTDIENRSLLWMCRDTGTWCFKENVVYTKESPAHSVWTYYKNDDKILAYAIKITSVDDFQIRGNLYPLDYHKHCQIVIKDSLPAEGIGLMYEDNLITFSCEEYCNNKYSIQSQYGIQTEIYIPNKLMTNILSDIREHREKAKAIDVSSYLTQIEKKAKRSVTKNSR